MLRQSFAQIPGIGAATEQRLWQAGIDSWDLLLAALPDAPIGSADPTIVRIYLEEAIQSLDSGDTSFFSSSLGMKDAWRAWPELRDSCAYLDIETDGSRSNSLTIAGIYDGTQFVCLVNGRDLDQLPDRLAQYKMVVTFFGAGFDVPIIEKAFPGFRIRQLHLDLCPTLRRLGLRGGLKSIERQLGIERSAETAGLTGLDAVKLWQQYTYLDNEYSLERLIAYNRDDCVNLERLAAHGYERLRVQTMLGALVEDAPGEKKRSKAHRAWPPPSRRSGRARTL